MKSAFHSRRGSEGICILGPTSSGRVVLENLRANGREVDCFVDPQGKFRADSWAGLPVVKMDEHDDLAELLNLGLREFAIVSGATASRQRLFSACVEAGLKPVASVHPTASLLGNATMGKGCVIGAKSLIGSGTQIGDNCMIGLGSILDRDTVLCAHVTVGAGVTLGAETHLGDCAFVGDGVTTLPGRRIGKNAVVVSGSVITQDIPADCIVAGVPARLIRRKRSVIGTEQ